MKNAPIALIPARATAGMQKRCACGKPMNLARGLDGFWSSCSWCGRGLMTGDPRALAAHAEPVYGQRDATAAALAFTFPEPERFHYRKLFTRFAAKLVLKRRYRRASVRGGACRA